MIFNIPNNLTLLRIALIPCLILVFYLSDQTLSLYQKNLTATLIFLFAAITDWLDGYFARRLNQTSDFGAFIDPVADKLIVMFNYNNKVRHVRPYKIVSFEGYWYLYGEEVLTNSLKTFYFKDITHLEVTDETYIPDEKAYAILERSINAWFEPNSEYFEVIVNASADIAKYFERRPIATTQRIVKIYKDGSMDIALLATSDREILHEVKKWMPDLIVVSPKTLALKAKDNADKFLSRQIAHLIQ